jgi:O-antigen biosynthesis protein
MKFTCKPIKHLVSLPRANEWRATGNDAQFLLNAVDQTVIVSGWYKIQATLKTQKGVLIDPCLYFDVGSGFSESSKFDLHFGCDQDWQQGQIIVLPAGVMRLRLDPSNQICDFELPEIGLKKLSRASAAIQMSTAIYKRLFGRRKKFAFILEAITQVLKFNISSFGDWLWRTYNTPRDVSYSKWIQLYETHHNLDPQQINQMLAQLADGKKISILLPVYNTPEKWLRRCIESVISQFYENWELCIADDASTKPEIKKILNEFAIRDKRIKVNFREKNGHISAASNTALAIATGEYVALLDHDDELPTNALYEVAVALDKNPHWRLIYSDEDKIDEAGLRFDPYFKPDWNYDLFLSQNCISHLGVYHAGMLRSIGGFREGFEGSQDYDLAIRLIEKLQPEQIGHIPKVLYHWRAIEGSTALGAQQKSYAQVAACKTINEHFDRQQIRAEAIATKAGFQRITYQLPPSLPFVSLIIPTRDRVDLLQMSVGSILKKTKYDSFEIIIINNQSQKSETLKYFDNVIKDNRVKIVDYNAPFNFSALNNHAVKHASGSIIGLVNNDIEVIHGDWLSEMASHAARPGVGAVGAKLYYPNDTIQHAGVIVGLGGVAGHAYHRESMKFLGQASRACLTQNLSAVTAACLLVSKQVFDEVGGLDETLGVAFNDVDLCLRILRAGYRNVWTPFAELYHHESLSRGYEDTPEKRARFQAEVLFMKQRWAAELGCDPAYNPNLTLSGNAFDLAYPPRHLSDLQ